MLIRGPRLFLLPLDPGSAAHHFVLRCARDTSSVYHLRSSDPAVLVTVPSVPVAAPTAPPVDDTLPAPVSDDVIAGAPQVRQQVHGHTARHRAGHSRHLMPGDPRSKARGGGARGRVGDGDTGLVVPADARAGGAHTARPPGRVRRADRRVSGGRGGCPRRAADAGACSRRPCQDRGPGVPRRSRCARRGSTVAAPGWTCGV